MAEQEIKSFNWLEELDLEPETLRRVYTSDFFQRAIAHLFALYQNTWKAVRCDANGYLLTMSPYQYIEKYDVIEATAGDTESSLYSFNFPSGVTTTKLVEIHTTTYPILVRFVPADGTVLEQIYHQAGMIIFRAIAVKGFKIQNATAGQNAFIRVIGWY